MDVGVRVRHRRTRARSHRPPLARPTVSTPRVPRSLLRVRGEVGAVPLHCAARVRDTAPPSRAARAPRAHATRAHCAVKWPRASLRPRSGTCACSSTAPTTTVRELRLLAEHPARTPAHRLPARVDFNREKATNVVLLRDLVDVTTPGRTPTQWWYTSGPGAVPETTRESTDPPMDHTTFVARMWHGAAAVSPSALVERAEGTIWGKGTEQHIKRGCEWTGAGTRAPAALVALSTRTSHVSGWVERHQRALPRPPPPRRRVAVPRVRQGPHRAQAHLRVWLLARRVRRARLRGPRERPPTAARSRAGAVGGHHMGALSRLRRCATAASQSPRTSPTRTSSPRTTRRPRRTR